MRLLILISTIALTACSSAPLGPDWIRQPTRVVDGGYIVYIGTATASNDQRAQFMAEGQALEDLANECSLIPKGSRIEDRYIEKDKHDSKAYVKLAVEFQECDAATHANDPERIKEVANVPFTEQLKRYQDLMETGEMPDKAVAEVTPPAQMAPPPVRNVAWNDQTYFFVQRQYVAYEKQVVVLAPPAAYPPGAPQTVAFTNTITPTANTIHTTAIANPTITKQSWSQVPQRPALARPASLAPKTAALHEVRPPQQHGNRGGLHPNPRQQQKQKRKGRRRERD